jgi:transcriptional regulator with XRE-family HTH domain
VLRLWERRHAEGMKQSDVCRILDRHPSWVSRNLRGPANWTLRTFGELVEALNGELTISVEPREECAHRANYHAYVAYDAQLSALLPAESANALPTASKNYGLQKTPPQSQPKPTLRDIFGLDH